MRPLRPLEESHLFPIAIRYLLSKPIMPRATLSGKKCYLFKGRIYLFTQLRLWLEIRIFFSPHFKVVPQYNMYVFYWSYQFFVWMYKTKQCSDFSWVPQPQNIVQRVIRTPERANDYQKYEASRLHVCNV